MAFPGSRRSEQSRSRPRTRMSSTSEVEKRICARTGRTATACIVRPTPARPGRTSASTTRDTLRASSSTRAIPTACSSPRWGMRAGRTRCAACTARPMAARAGSACCSATIPPARSTSRWTRAIHASLRGALAHAAHAVGLHRPATAVCGRRQTAAIPGGASRSTPASRRIRSDASASRVSRESAANVRDDRVSARRFDRRHLPLRRRRRDLAANERRSALDGAAMVLQRRHSGSDGHEHHVLDESLNVEVHRRRHARSPASACRTATRTRCGSIPRTRAA